MANFAGHVCYDTEFIFAIVRNELHARYSKPHPIFQPGFSFKGIISPGNDTCKNLYQTSLLCVLAFRLYEKVKTLDESLSRKLEIQEPSITTHPTINTRYTVITRILHKSSGFVEAIVGESLTKVHQLRKLEISVRSARFSNHPSICNKHLRVILILLIPVIVHPYTYSYVASPVPSGAWT